MTHDDGENLIDVIIADHRAMEELFDQLESGARSAAQRRDLADHVIATLVCHSVVEELYLYPAAREFLEDGGYIAAREIQGHAVAEQVMKDLEGIAPTAPEFDDLLNTLIADVRGHFFEEEQDLLPRLEDRCSDEQLRDLGAKVLRVKRDAPARPHPNDADALPSDRMLDPGIGLVDRMRDRLIENNG